MGLTIWIMMLLAVAVDMPYKELASGEHYDCLDLTKYADADKKTWLAIADYCAYDLCATETCKWRRNFEEEIHGRNK